MTNVYLETYGCSLNVADSEQMAGLLKEAKFEIVEELEEADVVILNSCTVKGPTETAFYKRLEEIKKEHPYKIVIVAGCIAQTDPEKLEGYALVGTKQIQNIVSVVEEVLNDNQEVCLANDELPSVSLPKVRKNPIVEIIAICRGCLGNCAYCKTKAARGNLISYPIEEIKMRVRRALREGVKEVWLTAQDCGCYGFDIDTNLAELLKTICTIESDFKIRVGMMNPNHLLKIKDELIEAYKDEKVFKFLHLPVQAGNNEVLKAMRRKYTVEDFEGLVLEFRKHFPELTLGTDVIVGFPGETEEQYLDTLSLVRRITPDVLNISKFWPRPKTIAEKMKEQVKGDEVKRRSGVMADIFNNISRMQNEKWLRWEGEIIIDGKGTEEGQMVGHNFAYKPVIVGGKFSVGDKSPQDSSKAVTLGERVKVKIERVKTWDLRGRIL